MNFFAAIAAAAFVFGSAVLISEVLNADDGAHERGRTPGMTAGDH